MRIVDEYDVFCRELTGLVAERLAGRPVTRQTLIAAFRGALDALSPPDVTVAEPETGEVPSDIAELLHWFASSAEAKKPSPQLTQRPQNPPELPEPSHCR